MIAHLDKYLHHKHNKLSLSHRTHILKKSVTWFHQQVPVLWDNGLYPVNCILIKSNGQNRWDNQTVSRGGSIKTREFWEEGSPSLQS